MFELFAHVFKVESWCATRVGHDPLFRYHLRQFNEKLRQKQPDQRYSHSFKLSCLNKMMTKVFAENFVSIWKCFYLWRILFLVGCLFDFNSIILLAEFNNQVINGGYLFSHLIVKSDFFWWNYQWNQITFVSNCQ